MTYLELRNLIVKYLKRKDLDAMVPEFLSQGEQMLRDGVEDVTPRGIVNGTKFPVNLDVHGRISEVTEQKFLHQRSQTAIAVWPQETLTTCAGCT